MESGRRRPNNGVSSSSAMNLRHLRARHQAINPLEAAGTLVACLLGARPGN